MVRCVAGQLRLDVPERIIDLGSNKTPIELLLGLAGSTFLTLEDAQNESVLPVCLA